MILQLIVQVAHVKAVQERQWNKYTDLTFFFSTRPEAVLYNKTNKQNQWIAINTVSPVFQILQLSTSTKYCRFSCLTLNTCLMGSKYEHELRLEQFRTWRSAWRCFLTLTWSGIVCNYINVPFASVSIGHWQVGTRSALLSCFPLNSGYTSNPVSSSLAESYHSSF